MRWSIDGNKYSSSGTLMYRDIRPMTITYKGESVTFDMPGWYCDESEECVHEGPDMKFSDRALTELKAKIGRRVK